MVCGGTDVDESQQTLFKNLVAFVRQSDDHAPKLTVAETLLFSGMCKDQDIRLNKKGTQENGKVGLTLAGLGLAHVKDTFVGNEQIRGVSGGQRRRVTLGEMLTFDTPLLCGDEISTGLDTASTVDILRILSYMSRLVNRITVVSLLQPSPEALSLFDEVILLGDNGGQVIYAGPTESAQEYFRKLGYQSPDGMDTADFLLAVASSDRNHLFHPDMAGDDDVVSAVIASTSTDGQPHTSEQLGEHFQMSKEHDVIMRNQMDAWEHDWRNAPDDANEGDASERDGSGSGGDKAIPTHFLNKYQNNFTIQTWLSFKRGIVLWKRDWTNIVAKLIQTFNVGLSTGFLFKNYPQDSSYFGALYQITTTSKPVLLFHLVRQVQNLHLFIAPLIVMSTSSTTVFQQMDDREVFYKHHDSNFYSALTYVLGKALAMIPQQIVDTLLLGSLVYWLVGFAPTASNFIIYLLSFFVFNFTMLQLFGKYSLEYYMNRLYI